MCNDSDQLNLSAQSSLESDIHETLKTEIAASQVNFQESLSSTLSMCRWLEDRQQYLNWLTTPADDLDLSPANCYFPEAPKGKMKFLIIS